MSLLCIGVQNAQTVVGLATGEDLTAHWRVSTGPQRTADDWAMLLRTLVGSASAEATVEGVALCSAVPAALDELRIVLATEFASARQVVVGPGLRTGLPVLTDNPRELGTDRVANAVGAIGLVGAPCVVVDVGTATTVDVVNAKGQYLGGAIAPGIRTSLEALGQQGAQLRQVELLAPRTAIARNTIEALQSGAVYGFAALVDGLVNRMVAELPATGGEPGATVIATGPLAGVLVDHCTTVAVHEPWLMLHGLRRLYERSAG